MPTWPFGLTTVEIAIAVLFAMFIGLLHVAARFYREPKVEFQDVWHRRKATRKKG
jgi:hypothetical protein